MTPDEINAFLTRFTANVPQPSDHVTVGPHPPEAHALHAPLADMVNLNAWLDDQAIPECG